ncbi:MAG: cytochrome c oxidase assembly protein [Acidobacteria bacterium]|nr:cytochrome c oxidase assembly protein [Acidobacteriota bacterium]
MTPSPSSFSWEPLFLALVVAAAVAYAHAVRVDRPSRARVTVFALGLTLVVAALCSPLETIARHYLLLFHLLGNVMIADWAPPLLVLGLTPARRVAIAARVAPLMRPWLTLGVWLVIWYLVHLPAFYDYALRHTWALNVEHALLIFAGLLFWLPVFARRLSTPGTLAYLGIAFIGSMFLGLAFTFSSTVFYAFYENAPRLWGFSAAKDQNLGGILMNVEQTLVFLAALAYFLIRLLDEEQEQHIADEQKQGASPRPVSLSSDRPR